MYRLYSFVMIIFTVNFVYAQNECNDCLKIEVLKNEYYDAYNKIPNGYIVDERGDTFDFNLLDLKLTFSTSTVNYMVYAGAFDVPVYYSGDNTVHGLGHATNLDSFTQKLPYSVVLVENQQGDIKLLSTRPEKEYPAMDDGRTDLPFLFYQSYKIVDDSVFSMQIRILNNRLRIKQSDTMVRFHYLYRPSIGYLRDYFGRKEHLTRYFPYADSARCLDCSNVQLISNWFELTSENEVKIIKKKALDDIFIPIYRLGWPSRDNFQGNGLYEFVYRRIKYAQDKKIILPMELFGQEYITVGLTDSSMLPLQLLIHEKGLVLNVNNRVMNDSNTGFIYSVLLDIEGKYTRKAYNDQLPLALNYSDKLSDLKKRYGSTRVIEEGRYVHLFLNENYYRIYGAKITYDNELKRIAEVELFYGNEDYLRFFKSNN